MSEMAAEQVARKIETYYKARPKRLFFSRDCSFCKAIIGYFYVDDNLFFDSNCACTSYWTDLRPCSFQDIMTMVNINPDMWATWLAETEKP